MATLMLGTVYGETKRKYQLSIIAGEEGLHRSLRWLYFSEDIGNAAFLRGGELMVITGFGLQERDSFRAFLEMLISKNCCGLIVNVGKYIFETDITPEIVALCQAHGFPLITMPWKFHLTDIIQEYSRRIFFLTHEQDRLIDTFQLLLSDRRLCTAEDEARLATNHFDTNGSYCVARFSWESAKSASLSPSLARDLQMLAENHLNQTHEQALAFLANEQLVLVYHMCAQTRVLEQVEQIVLRFEAAFPALTLRCGVGSALFGIGQIRESFMRAGLALSCAAAQTARCLGFSQLGIYQLFFTCADETVLAQFSKILEPLENYDAQYGSQLLETLRLYLRHGGRVNFVSDEMYCHRNTTNYRVKKIKTLLDMDLDEREAIFKLQLAFHLCDYRALREARQENA